MVNGRLTREQKLGMGGAAGVGGAAVGAVTLLKGQGPVQGPERMPQTPPYPEEPYYPPQPVAGNPSYGRTFGPNGGGSGSPTYGRSFGADTYGAPMPPPADTYYVGGAPVYAPPPAGYAPAPAGYAPAASMPMAPAPPPPTPSNWSMRLADRLASFNPAAGARTLALPNNLPGPRPQFRQAGTPPPMPLPNLPAYRKPQGM